MTAPAPYPPAPAPPRRIRWWLVLLSAAWAVLLVALSVWAIRRDDPTVPEQRTLRQAYDPVHRAAGELLRAAAPAGVVAFGPAQVERDCSLTPVRAGASATQEVVLRVRPGSGPGILDGIADRLPPSWDTAVRHRPDRDEHRLDADAGDFLAVDGRVEDGGSVVRLRVATGCRPEGDPLDWPGWTAADPAPGDVLAALGGTPAGPAAYALDCGARATVVEVRPAPADLAAALRDLATDPVQLEPGAVAYRAGGTSVVVTAADGIARVTTATTC
ncbi:hypothetical protein [Spirilliplanes yamanashiensis]|uniref:Uncharacterized protein n=1 Tax=Spirilliplanes yamanashiensis TaxID=42233 RepID=A0A8J4DIM2_9ACTN|nr:hypothetical protein [Spirilliplanes yamanashiensis]MDP9814449.1 hypothetical protein [Spirilliplanes yamanashiensis]GIJ02100.1 hypothetical protein Sya03_14520 [Spirilliplanes yamanashiensis]